MFKFQDRKEAGYLLAPTHEEEITTLVANTVKSYKDLPIRLHQISRKYRDELRPRHGLLRGREFLMKDLYTFDTNVKNALATYEQVKAAYVGLFDELKIPYLVAEADSGDMGGDLSHEFHFPIKQGEDHVISCKSCDYVANEELAEAALSKNATTDGRPWTFASQEEDLKVSDANTFTVWRGISRDRNTLINVWHVKKSSTGQEVNTHVVKNVVSVLDPGVENAALMWARALETTAEAGAELPVLPKVINLIDHRLPEIVQKTITSGSIDPLWAATGPPAALGIEISDIVEDATGKQLNLMRIGDGDSCSRCKMGELKVEKAIELGHTFFLGTRYSEPLKAMITLPAGHEDTTPEMGKGEVQVPMQMGCHGIGVSRLLAAVAETLVDEKGLNWPSVIAPFEAVIVPTNPGMDEHAVEVYDQLAVGVDAVLDDRAKTFPWKMQDADLVGYPIIVVVGRGWKESQTCEVQCRRLGIKENVSFDKLKTFVQDLRASL